MHQQHILPMHQQHCHLRQGAHPAWQGAGGTEFARNGSRTCFLRWLYKSSQTYFGQKPEEHCFSIKKRCLDVKNDDFREKHVTEKKVDLFKATILDRTILHLDRLWLKAGCRWYGICTFWVENLLFEVIYNRSEKYFGQKPEEHI